MRRPLPPGRRFHEPSDLLEAYANADFTFSDTAEATVPALSAYLRIAARDPARAATAIRQIDDLLSAGLYSEGIADEVEHLPHTCTGSYGPVSGPARESTAHLGMETSASHP